MSKRNRIKNNAKGSSREDKVSKPKLSSYEPVVLEIPVLKVGDEEIEEQMMETVKKFPEFIEVEDWDSEKSNYAVITMETWGNDQPIESLTFFEKKIMIEDENMPKAVVDCLLTMRIGEQKEIVYSSMDTRLKELDAEALSIEDKGDLSLRSTITLHKIMKPVLSKLTDEWVAKYIPGAKTIEDFRMMVRRQMEGKMSLYNEDMKYSQCAAILASRLESTISDELFERGMASAQEEFEQMLRQKGITKEQYLKQRGKSDNDLTMEFMMKGRQMIAEGMALEAMASYLNLKVEEEDLLAVFGNVTQQQAEGMKKAYEKAGKKDELYRMASCGKALEYVVAHAQIKEKQVSSNPNPFEHVFG